MSKIPGALVSADGNRTYRPPNAKDSPYATTGIQANFQKWENAQQWAFEYKKMKAKIKSIDINSAVEIDDFTPEDVKNFNIWITFSIGREDSSGSDLFLLNVCSPKWLIENAFIPTWGRHMLILNEYDLNTIKDTVYNYLESIAKDNWVSLAEEIGKFLAWEFEDYSET